MPWSLTRADRASLQSVVFEELNEGKNSVRVCIGVGEGSLSNKVLCLHYHPHHRPNRGEPGV